MSISMIGIDHNMAPVDIRAHFAFTKKNAGEAMEKIKNHKGIYGCVILSTCNRLEVWASVDDDEEVCQAVDSVSISLNMPDAASYNEVVRPAYGEKSFDAMLKFARDCKQYIDDVRFTVVDVIGEEKVAQSKILAAQNGIPLRVRKYSP